MKILKFIFTIFVWFIVSYIIFLFQPYQDFTTYINSLKPKTKPLQSKLIAVEKSEEFTLYNLVIELNDAPLEAYIKIPNDSENLPAIIILGGMMTGKMAVNYAYGVDNIILAAPDYRYKPRSDYHILTIFYDLLQAYDALYMQVVDNLILIEYLKSWEKSSKQKISILGYSFGVPFAAATVSLQDKISHLALVYGGTDLKFLIRHNLNLFNNFIDELLVQLFWFHVQNFEPECFMKNLNVESILLINGLQDEKIPESSARKLQNAIPFPKTIVWLESKHVHPKNKQLSLKIIEILNQWYLDTNFLK